MSLHVQVFSQAHSSVERACLLGAVTLHSVTSDDSAQLRGDALKEAIESDKAKGLIPFYVSSIHKTYSHAMRENVHVVTAVACQTKNYSI